LTVPRNFPIGAGKLIITGTGGLQFEERHGVVIYNNCHVILVQTSASTYHPTDTIEAHVVITNEILIPMEYGKLTIEIYVSSFFLLNYFYKFFHL
jgi:hypothetical protein